ncbi:MAG TPA: hypothetical protein PK568_09305 [Bacillota bacterium]|jgi:hypothetical protein|nr:hypothetical protein [Bacillota bacterium]
MAKKCHGQTVVHAPWGCAASSPGCLYFPAAATPKTEAGCINFIPNPSFETGLASWLWNNASISGANPFEGTQEANLGPGAASLFRDIPIGSSSHPLFFSFNVFAPEENINSGSLAAEILWLDRSRLPIATGLRLFIPEGRINNASRITYFEATDRPPSGTAWARLQFSKGSGALPDPVNLDQVILARAHTPNLLQNPGFELGLAGWASISFVPDFAVPYEGAAQVHATDNGILYQDVPLANLPARTPLLLSFAVSGGQTDLSVQVLWLDEAGGQLEPPGIDLFISGETLVAQRNNYLTYLDLTQPAPPGAAAARVIFTDTIDKQTDIFLDKVILLGAASANLLQNPSFEEGLDQWNAVNTASVPTGDAYEGNAVARIDAGGGLLYQEVELPSAAGRCFVLNFGYRSSSIGVDLSGNTLAEVQWLDSAGRELGTGLSLVVPSTSLRAQWLVYTGITEPAPPNAVAARVKFTRSQGSPEVIVEIDKVVLGRLI